MQIARAVPSPVFDGLKMAKQLGFLVEDHRDKSIVISAAQPRLRQRRR
jgi:hypothetical protein